MLIDLQVHSRVGSPDSSLTVSELVEGCKRVGLDGAALTEHLACDHSESVKAMHRAGLMFIPAREVSCAGLHMLVFSADVHLMFELPRLIDVADERLRLPQLALVWAHPAAVGGTSVYPPHVPDAAPFKGLIHGVEILNGRHIHFESTVSAAEELCSLIGAAPTGGSDAHKPEEVGRCATRIDVDKGASAGDVVQAIRLGKMQPVLSDEWAKVNGYHYRPSLARYLG